MEFSTLNGYKVKDKKAIRYYDTVNDMKSDTTLKNGMHVKTKGYYTVNDNGNAEYYITNTESSTDYQEELNSGLYATLVIKDKILIKQLGAKSGQSNDITSILSYAINTGLLVENDNLNDNFYITSGIETITDIKMKNMKITCDFSTNDYLFKFTNNSNGYNIELTDCIINGNSICYGVNSKLDTKDANNFILKNVEIYGMSSENHITGIFPTESAVTMRGVNCLAENCKVHNNQGHGLMFYAHTSGNSSNGIFNVINCKAYDNGENTYLSQGIGAYTDTNNAKCFISNCYSYNNGGSGIAPHGINNSIIENCISNNNREHGFVIQQSNDSVVNNCIAMNNTSFGIRVQGDFSKPENERFVNNVVVSNNKISGNALKVGVKAKNIICKNNIITLSSGQKAFYTDNTSDGRNNGSENVCFLNNIITNVIYSAETLRDYFKGLIVNNNTDIKGNLLPNGFLVYTGNSNTLNIFLSTDKIYKEITPSNLETAVSTSGFSGVTVNNDTFTLANEISADTYLVARRYEASKSMTFIVECPNGTVPWIRSRDSESSLIGDYILVNTVENNGYLNKYTITVTKDDTNASTEAIKYIDVALRTVKFESLPTGTYNFKIECANGLTINKV